MKTRLFLALTCALAALTTAFATPVAVGHPGLAGEKIDAATLKAVFLGKKVSWEGAGRITIAALKGGDIAEQFLKAVVEMSPSQFNNHWRRLAMTGGGSAPKFFEREDELRKFVAETPGAIGFLDRANADASVHVVP